MTERSTLERKRLSDLHQIASQLGIKQYRKYRKPELAEMIYKVATEQAASQQNENTTNGGATTTATQEAPAKTDGPNGATETPVAAPVDGFGEADTNLATTEQIERQRQDRSRGDRKDRRQEQRGGRAERDGKGGEENVQSGILDVLPDGFGFLRTGGYSQSKGDVYVSTSQIKRFNLRRGDYIVGQIRPAREGEKYPAMVRIETVNGQEPQKGRWRPNFDDLTPLYPMERLRLEWK